MITPVDYAMSSNVWASDKWKGVLKVRWIYIKDVPLASLRHIRLSYVIRCSTSEVLALTQILDTKQQHAREQAGHIVSRYSRSSVRSRPRGAPDPQQLPVAYELASRLCLLRGSQRRGRG
jgi:hypothetical protein